MKTFFDMIRRIEQCDDLSERRALADSLHRSLAYAVGDGRDPVLTGTKLLAIGGEVDLVDLEARTGIPLEHVRGFRREHARLVGEVLQ